MEVNVLRGELPRLGYGDGYGNGYGYGNGNGNGDGYGYGNGDGYGYGYGNGNGNGDGDGYGYGYGYDLLKAVPEDSPITVGELRKAKACRDQVATFARVFPDGATWPGDLEKARAAGLDVQWAQNNLGLIPPCGPKPEPKEQP